jgi:hypothetical protein
MTFEVGRHTQAGRLQDTLEVTQLEAVINGCVSPELFREASLLPLANATPLLETGVLESLSLGGGRG